MDADANLSLMTSDVHGLSRKVTLDTVYLFIGRSMLNGVALQLPSPRPVDYL